MNAKLPRFALAWAVVAATGWATTSASASDLNGFLRPKGQGDAALTATAESYDHFWVGTQRVSPPEVGEVENRSLSLWLAYGLTDDLTLVATVPYVTTESDGTMGFADQSDLQDVSLLGAYRLLGRNSPVRHDLIGAVGLRTHASDYEADLPVSVGDGTTDGLLRLVYLLRVRSFYASQQVGFDVRGDEAPDGYPLYTELGWTHGRTTYNAFYSKLVTNEGTDISGGPFPSNREEYDRAGAKAYVRINDRVGVVAGVFDTLDGRNVGDSQGASLGVNVAF